MSKCPGCQKVVTFSVSKQKLSGTRFNYNIVQCPLCFTAIGTTGVYNTYTQLLELREAIRAIAAKVGAKVDLSVD